MSVICSTYYENIMDAVGSALSGGQMNPDSTHSDGISQLCKDIAALAANDALLAEAHKRVLCEVLCCCGSPAGASLASGWKEEIQEEDGHAEAKGSKRSAGKQACVETALDTYEQQAFETDYASTQKAEVSYNMQFERPVPFMEKTSSGSDSADPDLDMLTNKKLGRGRFGHMANRAEKEFDPNWKRAAPYVDRVTKKKVSQYRIRRPDVTVVRDPSKPPVGDNLLKIFEMKFPPDRTDPLQDSDYIDIAGSLNNYEVLSPNDNSCNCNPDRDRGERDENAVPSLSRVEERAPLANPSIPEIDVPQPGGIIWGEPEAGEEPKGLPAPENDEEELEYPGEELPIAARGACIATWTAGGAGSGAIIGGGLGAAGGLAAGGIAAIPGGAGGMETGAVLGGGAGLGLGWMFCGS